MEWLPPSTTIPELDMYLLYFEAVPLEGSFAPEWGTQCGCGEFWLLNVLWR